MPASFKRLSLAFGLLIVIALVLGACQAVPGGGDLLADIKSRGMIRISTDPNYEPQSFLNQNGDYEGFDIDVANEIANRLGVDVEFVAPDWDLITAGSWGDRWDISVGSMTITNKRAEVLTFTEGYYFTPAQFAAREGAGITSISDLEGKSICVGSATTYETWLSDDDLGIPAADILASPPTGIFVVSLSTDQECAQAIGAGRTEFSVYLTSRTVIESNIDNGLPVVMVGGTVFLEKLAAAVDQGATLNSDSLATEVTRIINEMHADGFMSSTSLKWFEIDLTQR